MKTILLFLSITLCSLSHAQTPLLPLLKHSSQWQVDGSGGGMYRSQSKKVYKVQGDSSIGGLAYQILISREEGCSQCVVCPEPETCYERSDTLLLRQVGNAMVNHKLDTLFSLSGTSVGDSMYIKGSNFYSKIMAIDSIDFGSEKRRVFHFPGFMYFDGIGFSTGGPVPNYITCPFFEASSLMTRYGINNQCYSTKFGGCERSVKDIEGLFSPVISRCIAPLSLQDDLVSNALGIYVNETNELVHNMVASQIEIANAMGQNVLSNHNASKTDLNSLKHGVHIAKLVVGTQIKYYRFLVK